MARKAPRLSIAEQRKRRQGRLGMALIAAVALAFAGMLFGAYQLDKARGITVAQSLQSVGL